MFFDHPAEVLIILNIFDSSCEAIWISWIGKMQWVLVFIVTFIAKKDKDKNRKIIGNKKCYSSIISGEIFFSDLSGEVSSPPWRQTDIGVVEILYLTCNNFEQYPNSLKKLWCAKFKQIEKKKNLQEVCFRKAWIAINLKSNQLFIFLFWIF